MKKKILKRAATLFLSIVLFSAVLPLSTFAITLYQYYALHVNEWEYHKAGSITVYRDKDLTDQITGSDDFVRGETYYYKVVCPEGQYLNRVAGDFDYLDREKLVFNESFLIYPEFILAGDYNDDYKVNLEDVVALIQRLAGLDVSNAFWMSYPNNRAADYDRDGKITLVDVTRIIQYLAGMSESPHGGLQTDFEIVTEVDYKNRMTDCVVTQNNDGIAESKATLISSADAFKKYWNNTVVDVISPDDFDKSSLYKEYDESFFSTHDVIAVSVPTLRIPKSERISFILADGVPTVEYQIGVRVVENTPPIILNSIIIIDKGLVTEGDDIQCRGFSMFAQ